MTPPTSTEGLQSYFYTPSLKSLTKQLAHLAFFGDGLSVVSGVRGAGKTSLAAELPAHLAQAHAVHTVTMSAELELAESIIKITESLNLAVASSLSVGERLTELRHYVQGLAQDKKLAVMIIDDAHYLDDQAVGALVSLLQGRLDANVGLHLILLATPGLDKRIDALQILDVPVYDFDIPHFSPTELSSFLAHNGVSTLPESASVQKVWANSGGVPGSALALTSEEETSNQEQDTRSKIPLGHIFSVALLGAILIWSVFMRGDNHDESSTVVEQLAVAPRVDGEEDLSAPKPTPMSYLRDKTAQAQLPTGDTFGEVQNESGPSVEQDAVIERPSNNQTLEPKPEKSTSNTSSVVATNQEARPSVAPLPTPTPQPPKVQKPAVSNLAKQASSLTESESFLMSQKPDAYVLQVVAASKYESLKAYMQRQPNSSTLRMYRGRREGKSWFVVVQGVYKTRNMALNAVSNLPEEQAKAGPWPRKLSSIQEEIETFRRN